MSRVYLLTPEPIGLGSRFEVEITMMRRAFDIMVEFTAFERAAAARSTSRSLPRGGNGAPLLTGGEPRPRPGSGGDEDALVVAGGNAGRDKAACAACGGDGAAAGTARLEKLEAASGRSTAALVANFERRRVRHRLDESTPLSKGHARRSRVGGGDTTLDSQPQGDIRNRVSRRRPSLRTRSDAAATAQE